VDWPSIQFSLLFSSDLFARPRFLFRPCSILDDLLQLFLGFGDTGDRRSFFLEDSAFVGFFLVASVAVSSSCTQAPVKQQGLRFSSRTMLSSTRFARHLFPFWLTTTVLILPIRQRFLYFTDSAKILVGGRWLCQIKRFEFF
jgi:hypothetical protein